MRPPRAPAVTITGLQIDYGAVRAVEDLSIEIPEGATVAIIGPNGSGKSTVLQAIAGVVTPTEGTVSTHGAETSIVLQSTDVDPSVPITVRDAIAIARYPRVGLWRRFGRADRLAIDRAIGRLEIADLVRRQIHHLSGGQRQRVFVAQGLAQEAPILMLDEPLTGLDVRSRSIIAGALDAEHELGRTVITTTHNFQEARRCDLVLLLATRCIAFGPPGDVLTEGHLREAFGGRFVRAGDTVVLDDPHHE